MKRFALLLLPLIVLAGCGEPLKNATITGRVTDRNGLPVRDATVRTVDASSRTTTNGTYVLPMNRDGNLAVIAEYSDGTTNYRGRSVARSVASQTQPSVNITIVPTTQLARIRGIVRDRSGFALSGATVFAYTTGYLSSARAVTDSSGAYVLEDLIAGVPYELSAGGQGFRNDETTVTLATNETRTLNFSLDDPGTPVLPIVQNLRHITWVSPRTTRGDRNQAAYENLKRLWDPNRPISRASSLGAPIEVELNWDRLSGPDFYGYGIYRGFGAGGTIFDYDLYREPQSGTYIDGDPNLLPNQTYRYQVTTLGNDYPNGNDSEGPRSGIITAETLNDLRANPATVIGNTANFSWQGGSGADSFVVFIFDRFPGLGVSSIFNNSSSRVNGTTFTYTNSSLLVRGRTYWYLVLGLANSDRSRTISEVGQFVY